MTTVNQLSASDNDPSVIVPIEPTRILDTRTGLGLSGQFTSPEPRDLQVTGSVPTPAGDTVVVPDGATGVVLNVTAVQPTAPGFISVRPTGTPGAPTTSNLNFEAGEITPNAVTVALSAGGSIEITYDAFGVTGPTTDVLVDAVAYLVAGDGEAGPQGPQGPEGPQGPQGEPGTPLSGVNWNETELENVQGDLETVISAGIYPPEDGFALVTATWQFFPISGPGEATCYLSMDETADGPAQSSFDQRGNASITRGFDVEAGVSGSQHDSFSLVCETSDDAVVQIFNPSITVQYSPERYAPPA